MNIADANVLITGASRGLGRAMAIAFAEAGAGVIFINHLNDQDSAEKTQELVRAHGAKAEILEADVTDPAAVAAMAASVSRHLMGQVFECTSQ